MKEDGLQNIADPISSITTEINMKDKPIHINVEDTEIHKQQ